MADTLTCTACGRQKIEKPSRQAIRAALARGDEVMLGTGRSCTGGEECALFQLVQVKSERDALKSGLACAEKRADDLAAREVTLDCEHCGDVAIIRMSGLFTDGDGGPCGSCGFPGQVHVYEEDGASWVTSDDAEAKCDRVSCAECWPRLKDAAAERDSALALAHLRGEALEAARINMVTSACEGPCLCKNDEWLAAHNARIDAALASTGDPSLVVVRLPEPIVGAISGERLWRGDGWEVATDAACVIGVGTPDTLSWPSARLFAAALLAAARAAHLGGGK